MRGSDGSQSTLQPWAGGAAVSAPILVSGGQRFESSPVHFFSLLSYDRSKPCATSSHIPFTATCLEYPGGVQAFSSFP